MMMALQRRLLLVFLILGTLLSQASASVSANLQTSDTDTTADVTEPTAPTIALKLKNGRASQCQGLWAKQHAIQVGNVCVEPNPHHPDQLMIGYTTTDGWKLESTELWVGRNISEIPFKQLEQLTESKEGTAKGDKEETTLVTIDTSKASSLDLEAFPYQRPNLDGKYQHFGFDVKLFYLKYQCPDTRGTTFSAVAHATVSARSGLRHSSDKTTSSAWAGHVPLLVDAASAVEQVTITQAKEQVEQHGLRYVNANPERQKEWLDFSFALVCDELASRPHNAPERHHANRMPQ